MLKKSLLRSAPALRFPCFAWVPARALLARAFAGTTVHWTVVFIRLTLLRWQGRGSPSVANPLSGIKVHGPLSCSASPLGFLHPPLRRRYVPAPLLSSQSKNRGFCSAPFFKHLRVRKMCGASLHHSIRLIKIVFQQPASRQRRYT